MPATPVPAASRDESEAKVYSLSAAGIGLVLVLASFAGLAVSWPTPPVGQGPLTGAWEPNWAPPFAFGFLGLCSMGFFAYALVAAVVARKGGAYHWRLDRQAEKRAKLEYTAPNDWDVLEVALRIEAEADGMTLETIWRYLVALEEGEVAADRAKLADLEAVALEMEEVSEAWRQRHPGVDVELSGRLYRPTLVSSLVRQIRSKIDVLLGLKG